MAQGKAQQQPASRLINHMPSSLTMPCQTHVLNAGRGKISVAHHDRGWRATFTPAGLRKEKERRSASYRPRVAEAIQLLLEKIHDDLEPGEYNYATLV